MGNVREKKFRVFHVITELLWQYIFITGKIGSTVATLLKSGNFSAGMEGKVPFAKLFPCRTFPVYGSFTQPNPCN